MNGGCDEVKEGRRKEGKKGIEGKEETLTVGLCASQQLSLPQQGSPLLSQLPP